MPPGVVPALRVRRLNDRPIRADGTFVLYWMTAYRRIGWNFALDRALEWVRELGKPLVILEALGTRYPWASDRLHRFVLDGMAETARRLRGTGVAYYPYVEPAPDAGKGLLRALGDHAAVGVTDDFPAVPFPRMMAAAAEQVPVRLEAVDSNGLLPLRAADGAFPTAHGFRRWLQRSLPRHLGELPAADPLTRCRPPAAPPLPAAVTTRWPAASAALLSGHPAALAALPIDHAVGAVDRPGGTTAARRVLTRFLRDRLPRYLEDRNQPDAEGTSGLSPYLHFGHISTHEIFTRLARAEGWSPILSAGTQ